MQVIKYILGESIVTYFPRLELDVTGYIECLEQALLQIEPVFDASRGKDVSWVDVTALLRNIRTDAGAP